MKKVKIVYIKSKIKLPEIHWLYQPLQFKAILYFILRIRMPRDELNTFFFALSVKKIFSNTGILI